MRLQDELKLYGCNEDAKRVREIIKELHIAMHPAWTDEQLLTHPYDALRFCAAVRARIQDSLPDDLILRTLINKRKNPDKE